MDIYDEIARAVFKYAGVPDLSPLGLEEVMTKSLKETSDILRARFSDPILPLQGESVGVSFEHSKTVALFFDRIWAPKPPRKSYREANGIPDEIIVWGGTNPEVWITAVALILKEAPKEWAANNDAFEGTALWNVWRPINQPERIIAENIFKNHAVSVTPVYSSESGFEKDYKLGTTESIIAAIHNLRIVDDAKLSWPQVMDFRRDPEARMKLRRLRQWFDFELAGKPLPQVYDVLATKLDDYEWALKKHGLETVVGSLSEVIDSRFVIAATAASTGLALGAGGLWAALGTSALIAGKAALSVTTRLIDHEAIKRGPGAEIAYVHAIKSKLGSPS
jgi:hypothetical protein